MLPKGERRMAPWDRVSGSGAETVSHAQTLKALSVGWSVALGKRKGGSKRIYEWKSMLMYEPEPGTGQLRIMRWEELQSM